MTKKMNRPKKNKAIKVKAKDSTNGSNCGQFQPGTSGNLSGRPRGSLNKATLAAKAMLDGESGAITQTCIELAKGGDTTALRLAMDRYYPVPKSPTVILDLPFTQSAEGVLDALDAIIENAVHGMISLGDAAQLFDLVLKKLKAFEIIELAKDIEKIKTHLGLE